MEARTPVDEVVASASKVGQLYLELQTSKITHKLDARVSSRNSGDQSFSFPANAIEGKSSLGPSHPFGVLRGNLHALDELSTWRYLGD